MTEVTRVTYYVIGVGYDPQLNSIYVKLYDDVTKILREWFDGSYKAYCLCKDEISIPPEVTKKEIVKRYDALNDENIEMLKIYFKSPDKVKMTHEKEGYWENHIKFTHGYIYDNDIGVGMPYEIIDGKLVKLIDKKAEETTDKLLEMFPENETVTRALIKLFEYPIPDFKRASLDIEVLNESSRHVPRPEIANLPVICACIKDEEKRIGFLLLQEGKKLDKMPEIDELYVFTSEKEMLEAIFKYMLKYPFIITFNGDGFDFSYLRNRALRIGVQEDNIPLEMRKNGIFIRNAMHIDLYRFFSINAIKNYAFQAKYKDVDLNTISNIFLKLGKLEVENKWVANMNYVDLLNYCMRDAELTYNLTAFDNNLVMNLIFAIARISRMAIDDVSRKAVGGWIGSFLFYLHRQLGYLIVNPEDIKSTTRGQIVTKALIKGKQYKGAIVIPPKIGTHFNAKLLDYGSLYPSIIKLYNIGYATMNCAHEECKSNTFGDLPHWLCKKNKSLESIFIGSLRDLRLDWYKKMGKDKNLEEARRNWYKVVEQTIKVFMNASYGVFASKEGFVFQCPSASEEIAGIGRFVIMKTAEKAKELNINIIAGDTDSLFIHENDEEKIKALKEWALSTWKIDLELDKEYRYICFSERKKNYLGVQNNGEIDIKGMTAKKSHTPKFYKTYFEEIKTVLKNTMTEKDMPESKEKIRGMVLEAYKKLKRRQWGDIADLAFHVRMTKKVSDYKKSTPQHVKAVKALEKQLGIVFEVGSTVSFVKTNNEDGVKPLELAKNEDIDVEKYSEFLRALFEQILDPLQIDYDELLGVKKLDAYN